MRPAARKEFGMKFVCERETLLKEIAAASDVIVSKQVISVLSNIYLETKDGTLLIRSSDIKVNFSTKLSVSVLEEGSTTVPGAKLYNILSSLPDGEIEFVQAEARVTLRSIAKKIKFQLKTITADKYPAFPSPGDAPFFDMPIKDFREMITQTFFAITDDQTRPVMTGVLLEKAEGNLNMVATDGRRLSFAKSEIGAIIDDFEPVVLPVKILNMVLKRGGIEGPVSLCVTDKMVFINFGSYNLSSQLLEGQFPNYRRVIPDDHQHYCVAKRLDVLEAVKRVVPLLEEKQKIMKVYLTVKQSGISISTEENDVGVMEEELPCQYDGEDDAVIVFNNKYLEEPLKVIETDDIRVTFNDTGKAIMIKAEPEQNYFHNVMPMQT
jgi:DNA polymerase-3 subunit beta